MKYIPMKKCLFGFFLASTMITSAMADTPPPGSYSQSCSYITWNGKNLSAHCSTSMHAAPDEVTTMIINTNEQQIANSQPWNGHGNLLANGITPGGSWSDSCYGSVYDASLHLLHSSCKGPGGIPYPALIQATASDTVSNVNGTLVKN